MPSPRINVTHLDSLTIPLADAAIAYGDEMAANMETAEKLGDKKSADFFAAGLQSCTILLSMLSKHRATYAHLIKQPAPTPKPLNPDDPSLN